MITIENAIILATQLHEGQIDKQGKPYILHPLRVMLAAPAFLHVIAVLHDTWEDCQAKISLEQLTAAIDDQRTSYLLDRLSHRDGEPREEYVARILLDPSAVIVKVLDIRDNLERVWGLPNPDRQRLLDKYGRDLAQIAAAGYDVSTGTPV